MLLKEGANQMGGVSEYNGRDASTGLPDKPRDALSASELLRLGYTTGTTDPNAPLDRRAWTGETPKEA